MTVLEMLPEVICAIELLLFVAFAPFMLGGEVLYASIPIGRRLLGEGDAAVAAQVSSVRFSRVGMKGGTVGRQGGA